MARHTFVLSWFILFSPQFLHTAAARPLLPSLNQTGEPHRAPVEFKQATIALDDMPPAKALELSLKAVSHNLDVSERTRFSFPSANNRFCPVHGLFEKPVKDDHAFTAKARIKMNLKKVTAANAQAWIAAGHSAEARKTREIVIELFKILGYHEEAKVLIQKIFSRTWSCTEE